jgi:hypothetical protein
MHALFGVEVRNFAPAFRINRSTDSTALLPDESNEYSTNTSMSSDSSLKMPSRVGPPNDPISSNAFKMSSKISSQSWSHDAQPEQGCLPELPLLGSPLLKRGVHPSRYESQGVENSTADIRVFVPMQWEKL